MQAWHGEGGSQKVEQHIAGCSHRRLESGLSLLSSLEPRDRMNQIVVIMLKISQMFVQ